MLFILGVPLLYPLEATKRHNKALKSNRYSAASNPSERSSLQAHESSSRQSSHAREATHLTLLNLPLEILHRILEYALGFEFRKRLPRQSKGTTFSSCCQTCKSLYLILTQHYRTFTFKAENSSNALGCDMNYDYNYSDILKAPRLKRSPTISIKQAFFEAIDTSLKATDRRSSSHGSELPQTRYMTLYMQSYSQSIEDIELSAHATKDHHLKHIPYPPNLKGLYLAYTKITNSGLGNLCCPGSIETLDLSSCDLIPAGGFSGIKALRKLSELDLSNTAIRDRDLILCRELPFLERLVLMSCRNLSKKMFRYLGLAPALSHLNIRCNRLSNEDLSECKYMTQIRELDISYSQSNKNNQSLSDGCTPYLAALTQLQSLYIRDNHITYKGIARFARCMINLKQLDLHYTPFLSDDGIKSLASLPNLSGLDLSMTGIEGTTLASLSRVSILDLSSCRDLSNQSLDQLSFLTQLSTLRLRGLGSIEGFSKLAGLTQLLVLDVSRSNFSDDNLEQLSTLQNLSQFYLNQTRVTGAGFSNWKGFTRLKDLNLDECNRFSKESLPYIARFTELLSLSLDSEGITGTDFFEYFPFKHLRKLRRLFLHTIRISDEGIALLSQLVQLRELSLSDCEIDASADFTEFSSLTALRSLFFRLRDKKIPNRAKESLLKALPCTDIKCIHHGQAIFSSTYPFF